MFKNLIKRFKKREMILITLMRRFGVEYSLYIAPSFASELLGDGIVGAVEDYLAREKNKGNIIGWDQAAFDWFKAEYKTWFSEIVNDDLFDFVRLTGQEKGDRDIKNFYKAIGYAMMNVPAEKFPKIAREINECLLWKSYPDLVEMIGDNGVHPVMELSAEQTKQYQQ